MLFVGASGRLVIGSFRGKALKERRERPAVGWVYRQWSRLVACIGNSDQMLTTVPKGNANGENGRMGGDQIECMSKSCSKHFPLGNFLNFECRLCSLHGEGLR